MEKKTKKVKEQQLGTLLVNDHVVVVYEKSKPLLDNLANINETSFLFYNQHFKPLTESGAYFVLKSIFTEIGKPYIRPIDLLQNSHISHY